MAQPQRNGANQNRQGSQRSNQKRSSKNRRRRSRAADARAQKKFWGVDIDFPEINRSPIITEDPAAIVRSLGRPPLPGHETVAEHYFDAFYERAVMLAGALAAAGEMIEPEDLLGEG